MNKQRYLAELEQLLVFMTRADREETIRRYEAMFDDAGPAGEKALADKLGSPTRVAIRLSRDYEPGTIDVPAAPAQPADTAAEPARPDALTAAEQALMLELDELPQFDLPEMELPEKELPAAEPQETPAEEAPVEEIPAEEEPVEEVDVEETPPAKQSPIPKREPRDWRVVPREEEPGRAEEQEQIIRTVPLGAGIPLFVAAMLLVGVPVGAVLLGLAVALLCPGAGVLIGAWLVFVGGLWCISYIADAILMFGLAFLVLCVGILILWCGFWLGFQLVKVYVLAVRALAGLLLGRKVKGDA